ncbi:MAG: excinuclease ABC subunit UvrC [Sandaracinaceae bacterium]|nr:excinuclease ABC subunit UvrC [Sandaracinaceae bacterium]
MLPDVVQQKLDALPNGPGVYVFVDRAGAVLYVGKARSLRSRVRSYFAPGTTDDRPFIAHLEREIGDLETFVVDNEKEAALLENELIKQRRPRYNVKLRDDKDFLSIRVDPSDAWPRLSVVRRPKPDGARYYGPYDSATSARQTLRQINRFFKLRTCKDTDFRARVRPCLQYQIKRCPAPCVREVDREQYLAQVELVGLFLEGRHDELVRDLERRMRDAAEAMRYEEAATYRDQLRAIERVRTQQRIATVKDVDQDVLGVHRAGDQAEIAILKVRGGHLNQVRTFELKGTTLPDDELVASFVSAYYDGGAPIPDELLLPIEVEASAGLEEWLSERRGAKARVLVPRRGPRARLIGMAAENAEHAYREKARAREDLEERLGQLQKKLRLPVLPRRIECVDVSHLGGEDTVAVFAAMTDGEIDRGRYRSFKVRRVRGGDDYGALYEVLARRLRRGRGAEAGWELPDLLVIDGGKGQLNVALAAMRDVGVEGARRGGARQGARGGGHGRARVPARPEERGGAPGPQRRQALPRLGAGRGAPRVERAAQQGRQEAPARERPRRGPGRRAAHARAAARGARIGGGHRGGEPGRARPRGSEPPRGGGHLARLPRRRAARRGGGRGARRARERLRRGGLSRGPEARARDPSVRASRTRRPGRPRARASASSRRRRSPAARRSPIRSRRTPRGTRTW